MPWEYWNGHSPCLDRCLGRNIMFLGKSTCKSIIAPLPGQVRLKWTPCPHVLQGSPRSQGLSPQQQQYQRQQLLQQQAEAAAAATAKEKTSRGLFGRRLSRRNSKTTPSLVSLNSSSQQPQHHEELSSQSPLSRCKQLLSPHCIPVHHCPSVKSA